MKRTILLVAGLAAPLGCSGKLPWLRGYWTNHPAALVGEWVDVEKSTPRDTSLWVLEPDGYDGGVRITRDSLGAEPHQAKRKFGYWYVRGAGAVQELCVNQRPGRDASSCSRFTIETDSAVAPPRRVIRLSAYAGEHHTGERVLVNRR